MGPTARPLLLVVLAGLLALPGGPCGAQAPPATQGPHAPAHPAPTPPRIRLDQYFALSNDKDLAFLFASVAPPPLDDSRVASWISPDYAKDMSIGHPSNVL